MRPPDSNTGVDIVKGSIRWDRVELVCRIGLRGLGWGVMGFGLFWAVVVGERMAICHGPMCVGSIKDVRCYEGCDMAIGKWEDRYARKR